MADYDELKRLAEKAALGPWGQDGYDVLVDGNASRRIARCSWLSDAQFIAAANPSAVLALIAENETLRNDKSEPCDGCFMADAEALKANRNGKILCDRELFENLRDAASNEAEEHRQCMSTYRPLRQQHLDSVVKKCDELLAATGKGEQNHG